MVFFANVSGFIDTADNCQFIYQVGQDNNDGDAEGDACDDDDDNDGRLNMLS